MTIADFCILAAAVLPYVTVAVAKANARGGYNNADPRNPDLYKDGVAARAWGAHLNSFEAFPLFAAAVLVAEFREGPQTVIDVLALGFIVSRALYLVAYLADAPTLRSLAWFAGFSLTLVLFVLPVLAA